MIRVVIVVVVMLVSGGDGSGGGVGVYANDDGEGALLNIKVLLCVHLLFSTVYNCITG